MYHDHDTYFASDCTLQCGMWLWNHDSEFTKWQHPAMWYAALGWRYWIYQVAAPCNVIRSPWIMTFNPPGDSALQCGRWLCDDMPCNSPKRPPYFNSTSGLDFDHITAVDMSFYTSLRNFIQIGPPQQKKMTSCRFSRWRISAILDFRGPIMGSLKSPYTTSYRSSIDTITLNCLVYEKIAFFCILATDRERGRQTDENMDSIDALSLSGYRERRLNKCHLSFVWKNKENVLFEQSFSLLFNISYAVHLILELLPLGPTGVVLFHSLPPSPTS